MNEPRYIRLYITLPPGARKVLDELATEDAEPTGARANLSATIVSLVLAEQKRRAKRKEPPR